MNWLSRHQKGLISKLPLNYFLKVRFYLGQTDKKHVNAFSINAVTDAIKYSRTLLYFLKIYIPRVDNHNKIQLNIYGSNKLHELQRAWRAIIQEDCILLAPGVCMGTTMC